VTRRIQSNELASAEFEAAVRWYEERRRGLGVEFFDAVSLTMALIAERPEIGTLISGSTRRVVVSRFPYQVVYHLSPAHITIVAVAHLKRRPDYWKTRS
jgi:plasmid stabilization system protein ParE